MSASHAKPEPRAIVATLADGTRETVSMLPGDFAVLKRIAESDGRMEILHARKEFTAMRAKGLAKASYVPRGDWTVAVIALTELGRAVLAAEFQR